MANIINKKFRTVVGGDELDLIYASKYVYTDKGRKKRAKQAINRRFRRAYKQNEENISQNT